MKKIMLFLLIFILMMGAYVAGHFAVYFGLVKFFLITSPLVKKILIGVLVFLAGSFFLSTWLSHISDNNLTRGYYFFAGSWLGFGNNLLLFLLLAWILDFVFVKVGITFDLRILGSAALILAALCSAYGIWNAFTPRVTHLDVAIANLPESWKGKKIVQISDVHLGHIYDETYLAKVAKQINALKPDAIVITGDLFDGTDGNLEKFVAPLRELDAPLGVYFADGNHETYLGLDKAFGIINQTNIVSLRDQLRTVDGLQFVGIEYPLRGENKSVADAIANIPGFDRNLPSILLWHAPTQIKSIKSAGISLQLSGHTHKGQLFPYGFVSNLVYHGYDYGFKQLDNFAIYTSSGLGGWGPPMRTEKKSEIVEITLR